MREASEFNEKFMFNSAFRAWARYYKNHVPLIKRQIHIQAKHAKALKL